jgi:formate dehydrogenase major subunit
VASLAARFGRGAMTNSWNDIKNADLIFVMGGNPAENHPCGFKWAIKARQEKGTKIISVDVRYHRTAAVSDIFVQIRPGSDIAFMGGLINYVIQNKKYDEEYIKYFTNATYIVKDTYNFDSTTGLFSGYDPEKRKYDTKLWDYERDEKGMVKKDMTMEHPRCVFQLLKQFYSRYTPEVVEKITGVPKEKFLEVAKLIAETGVPDKSMTHLYALGWTHHSWGTQVIGSMAILQLLLGNIGVPGGGVNALRGHANIQGMTDLAGEGRFLHGYLKPPTPEQQTLKDYIETNTPKPWDEGSMNYWSNYSKFIVSLLKSYFGDNATPENEFCYSYLPKQDKIISWDEAVDRMFRGKMEGVVSIGVNLLANTPNAKKTAVALSNLKWMVVMDPFETEMVAFWKHAENPESIKTEVFLLPSSVFAEKEGTKTNSARTLKWQYKAVEPPEDAKEELWFIGNLYMKLKELYQKEGGVFPDPILKARWPFQNPYHPTAEEVLALEINGVALDDIKDDKGNLVVKKGERLPSFIHLKDDGTTSCGMWLYCGVFPQSGNRAKSADLTDPSGLGIYPNYGYSWPANRRILYNRASAGPDGNPRSPKKKLVWWNAKEQKWVGYDVPDIKPDLPPEYGPFIMLPEGRGRLYSQFLVDGPFPEHYEPYESPVENFLHPKTDKNPVVKVYKSDLDLLGKPDKYPYAAATYRVTEHFHYWTKHIYGTSVLFQKMFVEIPEELAKELDIKEGQKVRIVTARGSAEAYALPTKRIKPLTVNGKKVYTVGIPIHWGFEGIVRGSLANLTTPFVWDPNSQTPEFKGFLCNIEQVKA